jgi:hypothetical protein
MRFVLTSPTAVRTDWERAFPPVFLAVLLAGVAVSAWLPSALTPRCAFRRITGLACPTCGSYRAARLLAQGRVTEAARMQPLVIGGVLLGAGVSLYASVVTFGGLRRVRLTNVTRRDRWLLAGGAVGLLALNWVYLIEQAI